MCFRWLLSQLAAATGTWKSARTATPQNQTASYWACWRVILGSDIKATTNGSIGQGRFTPMNYGANFAWDDGIEDVKMQFRDGAVSDLEVKPTIDFESDRIPLAGLQGVIDPLTAGLIQMPGTKDVMVPAVCQRTLPIFDGSQRL